eukprot:GFYU01002601.1.p1 GENE.GFYU01002601.1~~GFYU01002601.1.p1  ORF type:complete len:209 (+),score=21.89 GFYU01002601.1:192-818(+)
MYRSTGVYCVYMWFVCACLLWHCEALTGGGKCSSIADCGGAGNALQCNGGKCICQVPRTCPNCDEDCEYPSHGASWPTCLNSCKSATSTKTSSSSKKSSSTRSSSGSCSGTGGGRCSSGGDCNNWNGGQCRGGRCVCFDGWACQNCNKKAEDIEAGSAKCSCPSFSPSRSSGGGGGGGGGLAGSGVMATPWTLTVLSAICAALMIVSH